GRARGPGRRDAGGIEAGAGAHLAGRGVVYDQHPHRPVTLGLEDETALEFQRRAEQHRKPDRLAQKLRDRRGIAVARKNRVDRRTGTNDAPAQVDCLAVVGQIRVSRRGRRWRECWYFDCGISHDGWLHGVTGKKSLLLSSTAAGPSAPPAFIRRSSATQKCLFVRG